MASLRPEVLNPKGSKLDYFKGDRNQIDKTWWLILWVMPSTVEPDFTIQQGMWPIRAQSQRVPHPTPENESLPTQFRKGSWDLFSSLPLPGNIILTTLLSSQSCPKPSCNKLLPRNCVYGVKAWTHSCRAKQKKARTENESLFKWPNEDWQMEEEWRWAGEAKEVHHSGTHPPKLTPEQSPTGNVTLNRKSGNMPWLRQQGDHPHPSPSTDENSYSIGP